MVRRTNLLLTTQTFVNFRKVAELYLCSLKMYHFQRWQILLILRDALCSGVDGFSFDCPCQKLEKKNKTVLRSIVIICNYQKAGKYPLTNFRVFNKILSNISSMRRSVSSPDEKPRRELKIRCVAEYF